MTAKRIMENNSFNFGHGEQGKRLTLKSMELSKLVFFKNTCKTKRSHGTVNSTLLQELDVAFNTCPEYLVSFI